MLFWGSLGLQSLLTITFDEGHRNPYQHDLTYCWYRSVAANGVLLFTRGAQSQSRILERCALEALRGHRTEVGAPEAI